MEMSIDEALGYMPCLMEACSHCLVKGCDKPIEKIDEAKLMVIETMRKYQKITEIMRELNGNFYGSYLKDRQALEKIYEVLEDGKIDGGD